MVRNLLFIIFFCLTLIQQVSYSQRVREFSGDHEKLPDEIFSIMGSNLSEEQTEEVLKFNTLWNSEAFRTIEMESFIKSANSYLARNARPVPHILNYLELLSGFIENDFERRHLPVWLNAFEEIVEWDDMTLTTINNFVTSIRNLIESDKLFSSSSISWQANSSDFRIEFTDSLRVIFGDINLMAINHIDTLTIYNTSGVLNPLSQVWSGKGGRVTWERAGLDPDVTFGLLDSYIIDLSRPEYIADSVMFTYGQYLNTPMKGRLTDRIMSSKNPSSATYPRFSSYLQELNIDRIFTDVDYEGGLSMEGAKLIGSGGEQGKARLFFYRENERWLTAESSHFVFRPQGTSSASASILFFLENDSIFHPDMQINYVANTRELSVNQNQKVISQSPWYNQFHQVDMSFAQLLWKVDNPEMRLTMPRASSIGNANFESLSFFNRNQYQSLQGMDAGHPLLFLRNFADQNNIIEFNAEEYSKFLRRPPHQVKRQLLELTLQGFIFYDTDTDIIRLRERLYHYLQANIRRIDYDIINFASTTNAPEENAIINLATNDMKVNGIPRVFISSTQNVNIFASNNTVTLKRNRNFLFDGNINAGNLSFFGENFAFDYDDFTINLQQVDSISLRAQLEETDAYGQARLRQVRNLIRNVTGELYIDKPDNKSGRVDYPEYPKFSSTEMSYVFYEEAHIQKGVYSSANFYFELDPFLMDSLNTFRNEELRFSGRLVSAGIFPNIEEPLVLQEDFSLGINHKVPENGLPAYGDRGTWFNDISMSNEGLRGKGRLEYLTSVFYSEDFVFLPDSANARVNEFRVERQDAGVEFPEVISKNNIVQWLPYDDLLEIRQTDNPFTLYGNRAELDGKMQLRSTGLRGSGVISLNNADITSQNYILRSESFTADTSNLRLKVANRELAALVAGDLSAHVDMKSEEGSFVRNHGAGKVTLPETSYVTDPGSFYWNMNQETVRFVSEDYDTESGLKGARYIATDREQDSLSFFSPDAELDYNNNILRAEAVEYIEVADALIYPAEGVVSAGYRGRMFPLKDARIVANRDSSYHEIYNASLGIMGKNSYSGSGSYDYVDQLNKITTINFDTLFADNNNETIASGRIGEGDNFKLSDKFSFAGKASLKASRRHLEFSGGTGISHNCYGLVSDTLAFESVIDPVDILIPVPDQSLSTSQDRIYSGIVVATDSVHIYPSFLSKRKNWADQMIISANGYMKYDPLAGEYIIASPEKLIDIDKSGSIVRFNPSECIIRGEGKLELGVELGQLRLLAAGKAINMVNENETSIDGIISLDFFMSEDAMEIIKQQADIIPGQPSDSTGYYRERGLVEMLGPERAASYRQQSESERRQGQLPEELNKTFVLSDVKMKWNKESRSYRSHGKLGIAYIDGVKIDKKFTGYLEITKRRSGDYLDFYIELDSDNWYYFGYTRGVMQTYSSNNAYLGIIDDLAIRHRRMRVSDRETRYVYMLATDTKINQFFRTYRLHLEGRTIVVPEEELQDEEDLL